MDKTEKDNKFKAHITLQEFRDAVSCFSGYNGYLETEHILADEGAVRVAAGEGIAGMVEEWGELSREVERHYGFSREGVVSEAGDFLFYLCKLCLFAGYSWVDLASLRGNAVKALSAMTCHWVRLYESESNRHNFQELSCHGFHLISILAGRLKKELYHGKERETDTDRLFLDLLMMVKAVIEAQGLEMGQVMAYNKAKLTKRFGGEKYNAKYYQEDN